MKYIEKFKNYWWLITTLVVILGGIWSIFTIYDDFLNQNEEILGSLKTTQQMALKSVIWNDAIPLAERASACDVYLNAGFNSLTKKECEVIIEKGAEEGIF